VARVDVHPNDGEWSVKSGETRLGKFDRYRDAQVEARRIVQKKGGGEVVIHSRDGKILETQTVPRAGSSVFSGRGERSGPFSGTKRRRTRFGR
jgi:hypothetical protein